MNLCERRRHGCKLVQAIRDAGSETMKSATQTRNRNGLPSELKLCYLKCVGCNLPLTKGMTRKERALLTQHEPATSSNHLQLIDECTFFPCEWLSQHCLVVSKQWHFEFDVVNFKCNRSMAIRWIAMNWGKHRLFICRQQ